MDATTTITTDTATTDTSSGAHMRTLGDIMSQAVEELGENANSKQRANFALKELYKSLLEVHKANSDANMLNEVQAILQVRSILAELILYNIAGERINGIIVNNCRFGYLPNRIVFYLINLHIKYRQKYFVRAGISLEENTHEVDESLCEEGKACGKRLTEAFPKHREEGREARRTFENASYLQAKGFKGIRRILYLIALSAKPLARTITTSSPLRSPFLRQAFLHPARSSNIFSKQVNFQSKRFFTTEPAIVARPPKEAAYKKLLYAGALFGGTLIAINTLFNHETREGAIPLYERAYRRLLRTLGWGLE
ncbi:hypothetical protein RUND412_007318 [Rhizina undulata]